MLTLKSREAVTHVLEEQRCPLLGVTFPMSVSDSKHGLPGEGLASPGEVITWWCQAMLILIGQEPISAPLPLPAEAPP